ncbi:MAG: hypothetical protein COT73_07840 [Bdellovibrio sp. CG10_big_fil_rev_8_21_14_0_10_47_8]|nr:MAG: hypothetical protein COT73_07840 [Bdellovibrio sp. CG10_big_fil_rev_8_21_14_0_10_47_8]
MKLWQKCILISIGISALAFKTPQKNDLIEISDNATLNARSEGKFRTIDKNVIDILMPGTRAIVRDTKEFPQYEIDSQTGQKKIKYSNYGMQLEILNKHKEKKLVWVYYDQRKPHIALYSVGSDDKKRSEILQTWLNEDLPKKPKGKVTPILVRGMATEKSPAHAQAASIIKPSPAFISASVLPSSFDRFAQLIQDGIDHRRQVAHGADQAGAGGADQIAPEQKSQISDPKDSVDSTAVATTALLNLDQVNKIKSMSPQTECAEGCGKQIESYNSCNASNNYLEDQLLNIQSKSPILASLMAQPNKEIVRKSCIQRSLDLFPNLKNSFQKCDANGNSLSKTSNKACVSETYVDITDKSFNAVANCLGPFVSGSDATASQSSLAIFYLLSHESGLHSNAVSTTKAAGIGQLTDRAIIDVNGRRKEVQNFLAKSADPICSQTLRKVFDRPMKTEKTCDRVGLHDANPLKNIALSFVFQSTVRLKIENEFSRSRIFSDITSDLPLALKEKMIEALSVWSHNTGAAGMLHPLRFLLTNYLGTHRKIRTSEDIDQFLKDLSSAMRTSPHSANSSSARKNETANFYGAISERMNLIDPQNSQTGVSSCLSE